jgi:DNA-directed RNA polymerase specialized sigma24 family protein
VEDGDEEIGDGAIVDVASRVAALEQAGAERVVLEVADYAGRCLNRLRLGRGAAVELDPEGLTQEAVERFLDGRWTWDRETQPSIAEFLKSRIPSLISNALTSAEYRRGRQIPRREDGTEDVDAITPADPQDPALAYLHVAISRPDEVLLQTIDDELADRFWMALEDAVKTVPDAKMRGELEAVLVAVYSGKDYGEIAEATGLSPDVVYRRFYKLGTLAENVAKDLLKPDISPERG